MMANSLNELDLHGTRAAIRGNPSFVWRAGQDRRLNMIRQWAGTDEHEFMGRVLVDGCGVGMYVKALTPCADHVYGIDIEDEHRRWRLRPTRTPRCNWRMGEALPYPDDFFDLVLSHEVIEHVQDDRLYAAEMVRVLRPGGRAIIFAPNRLYPFETHGHYWRGEYHFGNTPLINWLPTNLRDRLGPARARLHPQRPVGALFDGLPARIVHLTQIYPGYDNIVYGKPALGKWLKRTTYALEQTPLTAFGISHFLVIEKCSPSIPK